MGRAEKALTLKIQMSNNFEGKEYIYLPWKQDIMSMSFQISDKQLFRLTTQTLNPCQGYLTVLNIIGEMERERTAREQYD
jgi:hypothetical protein